MKSLKWKIVLMYAMLVTFIMAVCGTYILLESRRNEYNSMQVEMQYLGGRIADAMEAADYDQQSPAGFFADIVTAWALETGGESAEQGQRIYFLDAQGHTLYSRSDDLTEEERASRQIQNAIQGNPPMQLYIHQNARGERVADWLTICTLEDNDYLILIRQSAERVQSSLRRTGNSILIACGLGIAVAAILGYVIAASITRPLMKLTQKTQRLAAGELKVAVEATAPPEDELEVLDNNFNEMALALGGMIDELNSEKDKLNEIFRFMTDGLLMYNTDGQLIQWNPAAIKLLGAKIRTQSLEKTFHPVKMYRILESNGVYSQLLQSGEGYVNAVFVPFRDETEDYAGFIVVLQDITERHKMEALQKEFVANVSHELRTPITTIKSYVETLMDGGEEIGGETRQRFLQVIDSEADRMTRLITELLELSKMDSHQNRKPDQPVNLVPILQECLQNYRIHARKKGQEIRYDGPEELWIAGNAGQLAQVFRNLIINAITYSGEGAVIQTGMFRDVEQHCVKAYVKDNGIGIAPENQKRIFERFYRADKARSRAMGGTGLGLAIVKEIMDIHSGRVWVESELEKGSTFWLTFPELPEAEQ